MIETNGNTHPAGRLLSGVRNTLLATMVTGGLTLSGLAAAGEFTQATLYFERGELASAEGLKSLHERVLRAANRSCRQHGVRGIASANWQRECREEMVRELLAAIDSERLKQLHAQRTRQSSNGAS